MLSCSLDSTLHFSNSRLVSLDRLRTIIDYDKVLVLDDGIVLEYDTPLNLLANEKSSFFALCKKSGELETLKDMAERTLRA